jgi:hypothetical protein
VIVEEEDPDRHFPNIATLTPVFGAPGARRNPSATRSATRTIGPPLS